MTKRILFIPFLFLFCTLAFGATYVNDGNINWDGNWQTTGDVDTLHSSTNLLVDSGSTKYSNTWDGNASNTDIGILAYFASENDNGTITVTLQQDLNDDGDWADATDRASTTFTIDSSSAAGTWMFFKYSASHTENAGTANYRVKFTSNTAYDTYFRSNNADTTVIGIIQVLSATGTVAASDTIHVIGYCTACTTKSSNATVTVNVNSDETNYALINVSDGGVLSFSRSASTTTYLETASLGTYANGQIDMGVSGTPMPSTSKATFEIEASAAQAVQVPTSFKIYMYGNPITYYKTTLASDANSGQANLVCNDSTGWAANDEVLVVTTSATATQTEKKIIQSVSGTTITLTTNLSNTHSSGGLIFNMTRNVTWTTSGADYVLMVNRITSKTNNYFSYAELNGWRGWWTGGTSNQDIAIVGGLTFNYSTADCSYACIEFDDVDYGGTRDVSLSNSVFYNNSTSYAAVQGWGIDNDETISVDTCYMVGGFYISFDTSKDPVDFTFSNNTTIGSRVGYGIYFVKGNGRLTLENNVSYANVNYGIYISSGADTYLKNNKSYYNAYGLYVTGPTVIRDVASFYGNNGSADKANTTADVLFDEDAYGWTRRYVGNGITYGSSTVFVTATPTSDNDFATGSFWMNSNYDATAGRSRSIFKHGEIADQVTGGEAEAWAYGGAGTCLYMDPKSSISGNILQWEFQIPVTASTDPALKFYVKKTSSGANCTLNIDIYDSDDDYTKLVDNASVTLTDSWAQYSASSISPTNTGTCRVVLKALDGGTTGNVGIDDVSIVISGTTATDNLNHWKDGLPLLQFDRAGGAPAGGGSGYSTWVNQ